MRIIIDLQGAQTESQFRGIGRYTLAFAQAIVRNKGKHEVILVLNGLLPHTIEPIRAAFNELLPQEKIRVWYAPGPIRECAPHNSQRRNVAELIREAFILALNPDIVHLSSLFEGYADDAATSIGHFNSLAPVSVSLYDLIPLVNPDHYLNANPPYRHYYMKKVDALRRASLLLAISAASREEGIKKLGVHPQNIINVGTAAASQFRVTSITEKEANTLKKKMGIKSSFVLYTGGADERKNLARLIQSYANLPAHLRDDHQLVLAGKMPEGEVIRLQAKAKSVGLCTEDICFTGYISDKELVHLYNLCKLFVFPSWHEGFGLPALEAMACGAPVIAANTSSLPEVIGLSEALFDPFDTKDITRKLIQALEDDSFRSNLCAHGLVQAERFSWDITARLAIEAFEKFENSRNSNPLNSNPNQLITDLVNSIAIHCPPDMRQGELAAIAQAVSHLPKRLSERHLFVDISELAQRDARTGIQRVTRSILKELLDSPPKGYIVKPVYGTLDSVGYRYANKFTANFQGCATNTAQDDFIEYEAGDIFLGLDLQHHVVCFQKEYLRQLRQDGVKVVYVVYDLLPIAMPQAFPPGAEGGHKIWLSTLAEFDGALCISRSVACELEKWLQANGPERFRPFQIDWFHLGADIESSSPTKGLPTDAPLILKSIESSPTFLMVGTIEPRKGYAQTLAAFDQIWTKKIQANLVIVGKQGWMVESFLDDLNSHSMLGKSLFWLDGISDEFLDKIYAASSCLIAASLGEGFGLPIIEAAQHKLPIIARDIPIFREIAGDNAYYFSGADKESLAQKIEDWLKLYKDGNHPASTPIKWLTWSDSTKALVKSILRTY